MKDLDNEAGERALVEAAQQDPSRFAELYEANFHHVYAYIARRVQQRHDIEDLTAEVFHEALRSLSQFEWRGLPFAAWLLGIAAHRLADRWRNGMRRQEVLNVHSEGSDGELGNLAIAVDPRIEERALLFELVDGLPDDQRLVIMRRFVEQKSVGEIAAELGRSQGAIKQLQFRALEALRLKMGSRHAESIR